MSPIKRNIRLRICLGAALAAFASVLLASPSLRHVLSAEVPAPESQTDFVRVIPFSANDIVYNSSTHLLYASVPSSAGATGNRIATVDPITGAVTNSAFVGSEPKKLALADDNQSLYVWLDGAAAIRRFDIPSQTAGAQFSIGSASTYNITDLAVAPGNPNLVAVARSYRGLSPPEAGVLVFENGIQRPVTTPTFLSPDFLAFSASANTLYGGGFSSGALTIMTIDANGVSITSTKTFSGSRIRFDNGLVYGSSGQVINPATGNLAGTFAGVGSGPFTTDSSLGRAYFITGSQSSTNYTVTLRAFDISTFLQIGTLSIPGVNGQVSSLVRWGSNGLAFRTDGGQLFLIQSTLMSSGDPIPTPTPTPSPTATPTPTPFETFIRTVPVVNNDIAYSPVTGNIYAAVPSAAGSNGNSIQPIDPNTGAMSTAVFIGSEPSRLAMADDGQTLYAALDGAAAIRRFDIASQTAGVQFAIGNSSSLWGPLFALDMTVPSGSPNSVVVSRKNKQTSGTDGVAIYDNGVMRTNVSVSESFYLEPSSSPNLVYGNASGAGIDRLALDASGVTSVNTVPANSLGGDIRFADGLIYGPNGGVVDPEAGVMKGTFTGLGSFSTSSMTPDIANNRAFFLVISGQTATLRAYDRNTFVPLGSITFTFPGSSPPEQPSRLIRWGVNGLAFRTTSHIILIQSSLVTSSGTVPPDPGPTPTPTATPTPYVPTFVRPVELQANDIAYTSSDQRIYASVPGSAGANGNSVTPITPQTGAIGSSVFIGSEPNKMALSEDGSLLHVSLDGAAAIRQFNITTQSPGTQFTWGTTGSRPADMVAVPGSPQSVATTDGSGVGAAIYDNGVQRPNRSKGGAHTIDRLAFSSPDTLYAYDSAVSSFDLVKFNLDSNGVTGTIIANNLLSGFSTRIQFAGGRLYSSNGRTADPETKTLIGSFQPPGSPSIFTVDTSVNRGFYLAAFVNSTAVLAAYDINTFLPVGAVNLQGITGTPVRLVRWGVNGLAFNTVNPSKVYLLQTELVSNSAPIPTAMQLTSSSYFASESSATASITVTRTGDVSGASTIDYATNDGTAIAGTDYTAVSGTLTFAPGQLSRTISVPIINDPLFEGTTETFSLTLTNPTGGALLLSPAAAIVNISDNDSRPSISIVTTLGTAEGDSATKTMTFPVTLSNPSVQTITVDYNTLDVTANAGSDYVPTSGTLTFPPGTTTNSINVTINGDTQVEPNETFNVRLTNATNVSFITTPSQSVATIFNDDDLVQFTAASYSVSEGAGFATITVNRIGNISTAATVKYVTSDDTDVNFNCNPSTAGQITGAASRKCDYHISVGRLRFAAGQASKQIVVSVVDDVYAESAETFSISLSSPAGVKLGSPNSATITITDNDTPGQANPIDNTAFYVRMLYVDLLSREPEPAGLAGWIHRIDFCGQPGEPPPPCDRVTVGGDGFLRSEEFFDREFFVIRLYRTSLGRIPRYDDVGDLAYVSGFLTSADLELNKQELVSEIMSRPEFGNIYNSLGNAEFVDTLIQTAAVTLPAGVRDGWVNALNASSKTRAQVFRELSERSEVSARYLHEAQVVSCYYGFFTRNPDGAYLTFLDRLDRGEITLGDLANAFINAAEYRQRFGP